MQSLPFDIERLESPIRRYRGHRKSDLKVSSSKRKLEMSPENRAKRVNNAHSSINTASSTSTASTRSNSRVVTSRGDRFIPCRTDFNVDVAHYNLRTKAALAHSNLDTSPAKEEYKRALGAQLFGAGVNQRVLPNSTLFGAGRMRDNSGGVRLLDEQTRSRGAATPQRKCHRTIQRSPLRILDAPEMLEDYYLNLLDWNRNNILAVALNKTVYLWNASTGGITKLHELQTPDSYVSSLKWSAHGDCLAIGTSFADVQLWDVASSTMVRQLGSHQGRVSAASWHGATLATGSRDGNIETHDVRAPQPFINSLDKHTQEVCGLAYSAEGLLASGGNDNLVNIWDPSRSVLPRHTFDHHKAAVKGLAWCPWQSNLLASGGGTADRTLRFWDTTHGACLNHIDTKSQVCSILWSSHYRELVTSHGFSQNQLTVWKYPSMVKVCQLTGHTSRVLHMAMSPDGETVCSASGDETLRFWRIFERRQAGSKEYDQHKATTATLPSVTIR